jgi:hypothetical protein
MLSRWYQLNVERTIAAPVGTLLPPEEFIGSIEHFQITVTITGLFAHDCKAGGGFRCMNKVPPECR